MRHLPNLVPSHLDGPPLLWLGSEDRGSPTRRLAVEQLVAGNLQERPLQFAFPEAHLHTGGATANLPSAGRGGATKAGVKARCLEQFNCIDTPGHHRVTQWFLAPNHPHSLRADFDKMLNDGSGMSPNLRAAVETLARVPLDDCVCEGPHAQAKRIKMPATAAKWAWVAASMRLKQNLEDCKGALPVQDSSAFRSAWTAWATVLQPAGKSRRFPRMKHKELHRRLYRLDHLLGFNAGASSGASGAQALEDRQPSDTAAHGAICSGSETPLAGLAPDQAPRATD